MGMVAYLASEAEADLVSVVWGVEDSVADSGGGFGGVLTADFLAGGVFLRRPVSLLRHFESS